MENVQPIDAEREPAAQPVQDWWFTFGAGHEYAGYYVVINSTYDGARAVMMAHFGNRWSFQYPTAARAGVEQYSLVELDASVWPPASLDALDAPQAAIPAQEAPTGNFTAPVESRNGLIEPGWYLKVTTSVAGEPNTTWLLVEARTECTRPDCHIAQGLPWGCAVVTMRGRGIQHLDAYDPATVRIPADQASVTW
jgi:hypothetical protein